MVIVVAILVLLVYWQRDRIEALLSSVGAPPAAALEVADLRCVRGETGDAMIEATVRNISGEPLSLDGAAVTEVEGFKPLYHFGPVTPQPLPAGRTGRLELRVAVPPTWTGACRVSGFTNRISGKPVGFR
jgi:hypothetical protein